MTRVHKYLSELHSVTGCSCDLLSYTYDLGKVKIMSNLKLLSSDCRLYQRHSSILWGRRELNSVPLLCCQPHNGSLGLHHLPQVCVSPPLLSAELPLQPRSREDDSALCSVFTPRQ